MPDCPACNHENIFGAEFCENCGGDLTHLSKPRAKSAVEKSRHKTTVAALRRHDPVVVPSDRKVCDVLASLVLHRDGCAVVVDSDGEVVGVFTERDLIRKVAGVDESLLERPVHEFMTADPVTVELDVPIAFALHEMDVGGYRHVPVVEDAKPVGLVSIRDIITFLGDRPEN